MIGAKEVQDGKMSAELGADVNEVPIIGEEEPQQGIGIRVDEQHRVCMDIFSLGQGLGFSAEEAISFGNHLCQAGLAALLQRQQAIAGSVKVATEG